MVAACDVNNIPTSSGESPRVIRRISPYDPNNVSILSGLYTYTIRVICQYGSNHVPSRFEQPTHVSMITCLYCQDNVPCYPANLPTLAGSCTRVIMTIYPCGHDHVPALFEPYYHVSMIT
jgi:hypothetical protein